MNSQNKGPQQHGQSDMDQNQGQQQQGGGQDGRRNPADDRGGPSRQQTGQKPKK